MVLDEGAKKRQGCFQCSRRRIVCDRTVPTCLKCAKKGIDCSGLSRIRFVEGVARRGRFKDCKVPRAGGDDQFDDLPSATGFPALRWTDDEDARKRRKHNANYGVVTNSLETTPQIGATGPHSTDGPADESSVASEVAEIDGQATNMGQYRAPHSLVASNAASVEVARWIPPVDSKARMLFSYFSEMVAPAMVVLDDRRNGYRSLVLPMAFEDDLLRSAVSVVAAQHLSRQRPEFREEAEAGRAAVISRLRSDSHKHSAEVLFNKFTWATLIVLLVGETVTGSGDFRFFVQMLRCLSSNNPGKDLDSDLLVFLQVQSHMFELLGVPLLCEEAQVLPLMRNPESMMGFLSYSHLSDDCEDQRVAGLIRQCFLSTCRIYARCAAGANAVPKSSIEHDDIQENSIKQLITTISQISPDARGAHALVWVCFVAGAASTDQEQREFLVHRMEQVYTRTQFRNIPSAIRSLRIIWTQGAEKRWTLSLKQLSNVLVM